MLSIAHRDIKPQNILVDNLKHKLIISDFGSAKQLVKSKQVFIVRWDKSRIYLLEVL